MSEQLLDELAEALFGTEHGSTRLAPLLSQYAQAVGHIREDDAERELLQAIRTDWALCDAAVSDRAGDTWLERALAGQVEGIAEPERFAELRATYVGLFEVWPGRVPWLRDRLRGLCLALADPVLVEPVGDRGPAAIWEVRIAIEGGSARMCRKPLPYPLEIAGLMEDAQAGRFLGGPRPPPLLRLRRLWLQWRRAPRADAATLFSRGLEPR